eukprot:scaffold165037_cov48-Prasinocladus_malaysianus.AAC.1
MGAFANLTRCKESEWLAMGSVKSCFGHTEGAAGITGLWMAAFGLQYQAGPGIMHLRTPNPHVTAAWQDWVSKGNLHPWVPRECGAGSMTGFQSVVGSTSSFGISGVNAHCCIQGVGKHLATSCGPATCLWWSGDRFWPVTPSHGMGLRFFNTETMRSFASVSLSLECNLDVLRMGFAKGHVVRGRVLLPGSAMYETMLVGGS